MLSAIVANVIRSGKLIILSDIEGLYDCNPKDNPEAKLISRVENIDETVSAMIEKQMSDAEIRSYIKGHGFKTLKEDAQLKVKNGISTKEEMMREGLL